MRDENIYRVIQDHGHSYLLQPFDSSKKHIHLRGKSRRRQNLETWSDRPCVGDWVQGQMQPGDWVTIDPVVERKNLISRVGPDGEPQALAANLDFLLIAAALNQDFNLNRLDRYVSMAVGCDVQPVIVLTKLDLVENPVEFIDQVASRYPVVDVHGLSCKENLNLRCLDIYLQPDWTVALVGSSGVGKSTLVNNLLQKEVLVTADIRQDDGRGRHTTSFRSLHRLPNGAWVMDTPGLRTLALLDAEAGLNFTFSDIQGLSTRCRFNDCQHDSEPGCAVQEALKNGSLSESQWKSYLKLKKEEAYLRRKVDKAAFSEHKRIWKKRSRMRE